VTVYGGETERRLADRFREQRLHILRKKSDLPVAQHFNGPGHSLEDVRVAVLKSDLAKKDVRQRGEMRQTLASCGINSNFLFLLSLKTHARAHYFFACAVSKQHTTANSYLLILSGS